jgi:hypothetical protein
LPATRWRRACPKTRVNKALLVECLISSALAPWAALDQADRSILL